MALLTPEKITQAIEDAHKRNPGKILAAMEIYEAIAQAQYKEDIKDVKIEEKIEVLKSRGTKSLVGKLHTYEDALEKALQEISSFKDLNRGYLGSGDCPEVKRILGELSAQAPETNEAGRKMTIADKDAWLLRQRTENEELVGAINKQKNISFILENSEITAEMARRRLEGIRAVIALSTQQLAFLASG